MVKNSKALGKAKYAADLLFIVLN